MRIQMDGSVLNGLSQEALVDIGFTQDRANQVYQQIKEAYQGLNWHTTDMPQET